MVVGLAAFVGYAGAGLGGHANRETVLATWLVITFGGAGISWVTASLLFSMGTQAGHDIAQATLRGRQGDDGDVFLELPPCQREAPCAQRLRNFGHSYGFRRRQNPPSGRRRQGPRGFQG